MSNSNQFVLNSLLHSLQNDHSPPHSKKESSSLNLGSPMEFGRFLFDGVSSRHLENLGKISAKFGYLGSIDLSVNGEDVCLDKAILFTFSRKKVQESVELRIFGGGLSILSSDGLTLAMYPCSSLISCAYFGIQVRYLVIAVLHGTTEPKKPMNHLFYDSFDPQDPTPFVNSRHFLSLTRLFTQSDSRVATFLRNLGFVVVDGVEDDFSTVNGSLSSSNSRRRHSISPVSAYLENFADSVLHKSQSLPKFPLIHNYEATRGVRMLDWSCPANLQEDKETFPDLDRVLTDRRMCKVFKTFAESECSDENVRFWKKVELYRKISNPQKRKFEAMNIFRNFLSEGCPYDLNLIPRTRGVIAAEIQSPKSSTFDCAQKEIHELMNDDTFTRFQQSAYAEKIMAIKRARVGHRRPANFSTKTFRFGRRTTKNPSVGG